MQHAGCRGVAHDGRCNRDRSGPSMRITPMVAPQIAVHGLLRMLSRNPSPRCVWPARQCCTKARPCIPAGCSAWSHDGGSQASRGSLHGCFTMRAVQCCESSHSQQACIKNAEEHTQLPSTANCEGTLRFRGSSTILSAVHRRLVHLKLLHAHDSAMLQALDHHHGQAATIATARSICTFRWCIPRTCSLETDDNGYAAASESCNRRVTVFFVLS